MGDFALFKHLDKRSAARFPQPLTHSVRLYETIIKSACSCQKL